MDEETKIIAIGPRSRQARNTDAGDENQTCNKIQDAATVQDTEKLICSTQNRRREKGQIVITRDDDNENER